MQGPIDTIPSDAWKSCCANRFFFPQPQNLISPNLWISSTAPIELQDYFRPLSIGFLEGLTPPDNEPSHPLIDPGGPYYLSRHFHNTAKSLNLSCTLHHTGPPLYTSQAKTKLAKNNTVHARPIESPIRLRNDRQSGQKNSSQVHAPGDKERYRRGTGALPCSTSTRTDKRSPADFPPIESMIGGCEHLGAPVLGTVPLLIARPARPQTMFLDRFSSIESLIGGRGILREFSKTFEHRKAAIAQ
ncbi:hypothetical protein D6D20_08728 [Aureobasidium pullulans]|uniref:Uncharacterized protein n=1 Tax=Aureobasidium pullulans TaxID=5580 RepID=A0A4S8YV66_AURPU|nr:hypothetical protein D6D20_08728 [Aureobasidium pullulans]